MVRPNLCNSPIISLGKLLFELRPNLIKMIWPNLTTDIDELIYNTLNHVVSFIMTCIGLHCRCCHEHGVLGYLKGN